jgi:hypothetical protein
VMASFSTRGKGGRSSGRGGGRGGGFSFSRASLNSLQKGIEA